MVGAPQWEALHLSLPLFGLRHGQGLGEKLIMSLQPTHVQGTPKPNLPCHGGQEPGGAGAALWAWLCVYLDKLLLFLFLNIFY